jgi:hypothetical protein
MANDTGGVDIVGEASVTTSDNVIDGGAGNDVIVLGTTAALGGADLDDSNDTVAFTGSFGNDVIVNFVAGVLADGGDVLDFSALLGTAGNFGAAAGTNGSITRGAGGAPTTATYADATVSSKEVFISVSGTTGSVYLIADGAAANDQTITLVGTIKLVASSWVGLGSDNFA